VTGPEVSSIVLFSPTPERRTAFYRALGIDLADEDHGDGAVHAATEVGDVHVAVFAAPAEGTRQDWRTARSTFVGFYVESLDRTFEAVQRLGGEVLVDH